MLDLETLRIAQSAVGVCAFVLVYFGTYRATRAPYAGWWALVVVASSLSTGMYFLSGMVGRALADGLGNAGAVLGASFAWAAALSLRGRRVSPWRLSVAPVVVLLGTVIRDQSDSITLGTDVLLAGMAAMFVLAARQLWILVNENTARIDDVGSGTRAGAVSVAVAATVLAVFYTVRLATYVLMGPSSSLYETWTGPVATTMVVMLAMVVVTYSVTELSRYELVDRWRRRAISDDLTGLYARSAFLERAERTSAQAGSGTAVLILADFDHFKSLNDAHGHAAGDRALLAFGDACREVLRTDDLACRMGGEEFALLLAASRDAGVADAVEATRRLNESLTRRLPEGQAVTVSFGVTAMREREPLDGAMARADAALYEAKETGRARTVVSGPP